ncbi:MAG: hypothetical protein PHI79_00490 [Sulfurovaceae bacterium]|nr:hypothetical protein [Sulfurovaceae bacterium]
MISSYFYTYKFYGSAKVILGSKIVLVIFTLMVISNFLLITLASEKMHKAQEKQLKIELIDNKPCFYIDEFDGINDFDAKGIGVRTELPSIEWMKTEHMWFAGVIRKDIHSMKSFHLSTISDASKCIPYGIKNDITSAPSQKLQTDILYNVSISAFKRNIPTKELKDDDEINFYEYFYLSKNKKTGKIELNIPNREQRITLLKKMEEQNQSIKKQIKETK